jgi:hypothetical protein
MRQAVIDAADKLRNEDGSPRRGRCGSGWGREPEAGDGQGRKVMVGKQVLNTGNAADPPDEQPRANEGFV